MFSISASSVENSLVSVVIPTYNLGKLVVQAVESVLLQTYRNIEIIVVDDGSIDETSNLLRKYNGQITYYYQGNSGLPAARNSGIKLSRGEFIAFLDADDLWLPEKIEKQVALMKSDVELGLISCGYYLVDESGLVFDKSLRKKYSSSSECMRDLILNNSVSGGSNALVRRQCFETVGLFDETLKASEDWDMWLRICANFRMQSVDDYLVKIRVRSDSMSAPANLEKMFYYENVVLRKFFFSKEGRSFTFFEKQKAFSVRLYCAAWAYCMVKKKISAFRFAICSVLFYPFFLRIPLFSRTKLIFRLILGEEIFSFLTKK